VTHLVVDATTLSRSNDGLGLYSLWLTRSLLARLPHVRMTIIVTRPDDAVLNEVGRRAAIVRAPERLHATVHDDQAWSAWNALVADLRPDVYLSTAFLPAAYACRRAVVIHDLAPMTVPHLVAARKVGGFTTTARRVAAMTDRILAPSAFACGEVQRTLGVAAHVLYPDVRQVRERLAAAAPCGDSRYDALVIGVKCPRKNVTLAIDALQLLEREGLHLRTAFIGQHRADVDVLRLVRNGAIDGQVLGYVSDETLRTLCASARLLLFPSRHEGFGLPAFEFLLLGKPAVCLRVASLPEVLGEHGFYAEDDAASFAAAVRRALFAPPVAASDHLGAMQKQHDEQFERLCRWISGEAEA
jgi:glycosyltransferase involved in cell wall biosynthesis